MRRIVVALAAATLAALPVAGLPSSARAADAPVSNAPVSNAPVSGAPPAASGPSSAAARSPDAALSPDAAAGRALAFDRGMGNCLACHVIAGGELPGNIGPPLRDVRTMVPDRKQLYAVIYDETARNPQTIMPPFGRNAILTRKQIGQIVDFLETR
ncbi:MAG: sulfur oxidation c-type cytochrome SoxX [Proteobacteria bacterium]|nr:sulfur oxidation c-type cytochrome SoxX [Pseudomonadota bacterium]